MNNDVDDDSDDGDDFSDDDRWWCHHKYVSSKILYIFVKNLKEVKSQRSQGQPGSPLNGIAPACVQVYRNAIL